MSTYDSNYFHYNLLPNFDYELEVKEYTFEINGVTKTLTQECVENYLRIPRILDPMYLIYNLTMEFSDDTEIGYVEILKVLPPSFFNDFSDFPDIITEIENPFGLWMYLGKNKAGRIPGMDDTQKLLYGGRYNQIYNPNGVNGLYDWIFECSVTGIYNDAWFKVREGDEWSNAFNTVFCLYSLEPLANKPFVHSNGKESLEIKECNYFNRPPFWTYVPEDKFGFIDDENAVCENNFGVDNNINPIKHFDMEEYGIPRILTMEQIKSRNGFIGEYEYIIGEEYDVVNKADPAWYHFSDGYLYPDNVALYLPGLKREINEDNLSYSAQDIVDLWISGNLERKAEIDQIPMSDSDRDKINVDFDYYLNRSPFSNVNSVQEILNKPVLERGAYIFGLMNEYMILCDAVFEESSDWGYIRASEVPSISAEDVHPRYGFPVINMDTKFAVKCMIAGFFNDTNHPKPGCEQQPPAPKCQCSNSSSNIINGYNLKYNTLISDAPEKWNDYNVYMTTALLLPTFEKNGNLADIKKMKIKDIQSSYKSEDNINIKDYYKYTSKLKEHMNSLGYNIENYVNLNFEKIKSVESKPVSGRSTDNRNNIDIGNIYEVINDVIKKWNDFTISFKNRFANNLYYHFVSHLVPEDVADRLTPRIVDFFTYRLNDNSFFYPKNLYNLITGKCKYSSRKILKSHDVIKCFTMMMFDEHLVSSAGFQASFLIRDEFYEKPGIFGGRLDGSNSIETSDFMLKYFYPVTNTIYNTPAIFILLDENFYFIKTMNEISELLIGKKLNITLSDVYNSRKLLMTPDYENYSYVNSHIYLE
jgi:hypothetical protein